MRFVRAIKGMNNDCDRDPSPNRDHGFIAAQFIARRLVLHLPIDRNMRKCEGR